MLKPFVFEKYNSLIDAELLSSFAESRSPLYDMLRYHLGWVDADGTPAKQAGGKYLRPTICLSSCLAAGGRPEIALPAAGAIELVHNYSLVHDDIQDRSEYRRHRPTVWKIWGLAQAINAGDTMYAMAQLSILRLAKNAVPPVQVIAAAEALGTACRSLCEGQYLDIRFESEDDVPVTEYMAMIEGKTAALMAASASIGALVAGCDARTVACMAGFGRHLGMAFQIQDDILGIWEEQGKTGKSKLEDILQRKKTFPLLSGIAGASPRDRERIHAIFSRQDAAFREAQEIADIIERSGAREKAITLVRQHERLAISELAAAPNREGVDELIQVAQFMLSPISEM
ncbi:MAG: polyprenyl synthetase family protein [Chloroflexi bacterium]|nr:polyprenyl synthetase family protein [Chloroflexota bacterium]